MDLHSLETSSVIFFALLEGETYIGAIFWLVPADFDPTVCVEAFNYDIEMEPGRRRPVRCRRQEPPEWSFH